MNNKYDLKAKIFILSLSLLFVANASCKKFLDVDPPVTSQTSASVYTSNATAAAVLTGIYATMSGSGGFVSGQLNSFTTFVCGLSADELSPYLPAVNFPILQYYNNAVDVSVAPTAWSDTYTTIFKVNAAIEGLSASTTLTPAVQSQLIGEAKFMRAFSYFYLVNLYGPVPLALTSDYQKNSILSRADKITIYKQIIGDLLDAQKLLNSNYVGADAATSVTDKVRPNKWVATALLARAYLYSGDNLNAEKQTSLLINNPSYTLSPLAGVTNVFTKNSSEAIWQLQPVNVGFNTGEGLVFILPATGPGVNNPVFLNTPLLKAFEKNDARRVVWVDSVAANGTKYYFPTKYKSATFGAPVTEYEMVFRLTEQYLIRAEAEANGSGAGITGAVADLNKIRTRASLPPYSGATDQVSLLAAILHERQVELFTEWGHRWLDLKRTSTVDAVMSVVTPQKGSSAWKSYQQLYPLPLGDVQRDQNLTQNTGY